MTKRTGFLEDGGSLTARDEGIKFAAPRAETQNRGDSPLYRQLAYSPWRLSLRYVAAGTGFSIFFAMILSLALLATDPAIGYTFHALLFTYWFWVFLWPIVFTISIVAAKGWRERWGVIIVYFIGLLSLGALITLLPLEHGYRWGDVRFVFSQQTPERVIVQWLGLNLIATCTIAAFRHRWVRSVGPLVLAFVTVLAGGVLFILQKLSINSTSANVQLKLLSCAEFLDVPISWINAAYYVMPTLICGAILAGLGWYVIGAISRGYRRKAISDQSLSLDAIWLTFAFVYSMFLGIFGPGWLALGLMAFPIYRLSLTFTNKLSRPDMENGYRLLLLRVFSLGKRTEALYDRLVKRWRYVGSVQLIAGVDLAISTVAPHQFLSFLTGRLARLFIRDSEGLNRSVQELDFGRDADGRYRINDFFCHADSWQFVLKRLIRYSDVVLMDLRNFCEHNIGCIFELRQLMNIMPQQKIILIVDGTTNLPFLHDTLDSIWHTMQPDSPNRGTSSESIELVTLESLGPSEVDKVLRKLCCAAVALPVARDLMASTPRRSWDHHANS